MGGFSPMSPPMSATPGPPAQQIPQFNPSQINGPTPQASPMDSSPLPQIAGVMEQVRTLSLTLQQSKGTLEMISGQFPLAAQPVREASDLLEQASQKIIEIVTAVYTQAQEPSSPTPRILG